MNMKKEWKPGKEYVQEKRDGVTELLVRAGYDEQFRRRLLSNNPAMRRQAFAEGGDFENLPDEFVVECWEREGAVEAETDNTVCLILPVFQSGNVQRPVDVDKFWLCTWNPYKNRKKKNPQPAANPRKKPRAAR
jgi:hypothetical protein